MHLLVLFLFSSPATIEETTCKRTETDQPVIWSVNVRETFPTPTLLQAPRLLGHLRKLEVLYIVEFSFCRIMDQNVRCAWIGIPSCQLGNHHDGTRAQDPVEGVHFESPASKLY